MVNYPRFEKKGSIHGKTDVVNRKKASLRDVRGGRPIFYYTRYEDIAPVKQAYEDYKKLSHLQYFYMDDHRELAPGVFLTRYSNGEELVTNYSPEPFAYRGRSVKPMSNELLK